MKRNLSLDKKRLYDGVAKLAIAVGSTLGPKGRPVLIEDRPGHPKLTKDGVTVAQHLELSDTEENLGARLVAQAAQATVSAAGDGTTTSTVLADAIVEAGRKGEVSVDFIKGIEEAAKDVIKHLEEAKCELDEDQIYNIAHISTNSDENLATIIKDAFVESGTDGIVDATYSPIAKETTLEVKAGSYIASGYTHAHFVTNVKQRTCELKNPFILVSNATLHEMAQIEHILGKPVRDGRPIVIIGDFEKNFTESFVANVSKGVIKGCLIEPGARTSADLLRDLAHLLGGIYFDNANGNNFDYLSENYWGEAENIIISPNFSLFSIKGNEHVQDRIKDLQELIEEGGEDWVIGGYKERLALLNGRYATIKVGAPTQAEAMEAKDRVDDAVFAVGSAQQHGYLPGGGVALRDASNHLHNKFHEIGCVSPSPQGEGYLHLLNALHAPYTRILENAGIENGNYKKEFGHGVDASNGEYVDMVEAGIIDPAFVTMQSVINAASAACALLSSKASLIIIDESN